jgi:phage terminase large subunit-like protein
MVRARVGKRARAEPVAALYEQGRVAHCGAFPMLEEEMMGLGTEASRHSPDRADALVWALTDLMLGAEGSAPRLREL